MDGFKIMKSSIIHRFSYPQMKCVLFLVMILICRDSYSQQFYTLNNGCHSCAIPRTHEFTDINSCQLDTGQYNQYMGSGEVHGFPDGSMLSHNDQLAPFLTKAKTPFTWHQDESFISQEMYPRYNKNFFKFPQDPFLSGGANGLNVISSFTFDYKSRFFYAGTGLYYTEVKGNNLPILIRPIDSVMQITALSLYYDKLYGVQSFISGSFFKGTKFRFLEFDRDNNYEIKNLFEFEIITPDGTKFDPLYTDICLNTHTISCDSTVLFLTAGLGTKTFRSLGTFIYTVDLTNLKLIPYCSFPKEVSLRGLASNTEVAHTKCRFALDLDDNNTTDLSNGYYHIAACPSDSLPLHDGDLYLYSIYKIDSMIVEYMTPPPDGEFEKLFFYPDSKLSFEFINNSKVVIKNLGSANTMDFKACIQNMRYINTNYPVVAGSRMFTITLFAEDKIESAMSEIVLPELRPAGGDAVVTVCSSDKELNLFWELEFPRTEGGYWIEKTQGDSGWIKPGLYPEGKYHYVFQTSPCYSDTAIIELKYIHTFDFSLGNDTIICFKDSLILDPKLGVRVVWNDGLRRFTNTITSSGKYWASYKDLLGCIYTDTINVQVLESIDRVEEDIVLCKNEEFVYKGILYKAGDIITDTIQNNNECPVSIVKRLTESKFIVSLNPNIIAEPNKDKVINLTFSSFDFKSIEWAPSNGLTRVNDSTFIFNSNQDTKYTFTIIDSNDCEYSLSTFIKVIYQNNVYAPNVFSPNEDSVNDFWKVEVPSDFDVLSCKIFNYWGNVVYDIENNEINWNGKFNGENCTPGVYPYIIKYKNRSNEIKTLIGDLTLIR